MRLGLPHVQDIAANCGECGTWTIVIYLSNRDAARANDSLVRTLVRGDMKCLYERSTVK